VLRLKAATLSVGEGVMWYMDEWRPNLCRANCSSEGCTEQFLE